MPGAPPKMVATLPPTLYMMLYHCITLTLTLTLILILTLTQTLTLTLNRTLTRTLNLVCAATGPLHAELAALDDILQA